MSEPAHAATPRSVATGTELPPLRLTPTLRDIVRYAGASGDFYEMHYDLEFARRLGHPELSLHGLYKAALLGRLVTEWAGDAGRLTSLSVRYRAMDYREHELTCAARVETAGDGRVELSIRTENAEGATTTVGRAVVTLTDPAPPPPGAG
ncbi:MaoC/PaaZ C-terminal domain-containing protein [Marinactinospora rubrisoli]|uniref:MaoC/PaaZ C-terminal domain-containing protein n=1 Tax=Marinactinospora rubrisoli TaxID=2715399 RepID=A0ABW2KPT8_9ACTN